MKKIRMITKASLLAACLALTLTGCQKPVLDRIDPGAGRGILDLTIGSPAGRTIQPDVTITSFESFRLNFFRLANEGATVADGAIPYPSIVWEHGETAGPIVLDAGHWELQVTAFLPGEGGGDPLPAADGIIRFYLAAEASTSRNVPLAPIAAGYGTFAWDLTLTGGVTLSAVAVTAIDAAGNTTGSAFSADAGELVAAGMRLAAGRYDAVFTLSLDGDSISVSAVLYVYQNMTSTFRRSFSAANFAQSLIDYILGLWVEGAWNFAAAGITWEHFYYLLEIEGITSGNFVAVTALFNELAEDFEVPINLDGLKAMTDAALITLGADAAFRAAVYASRAAAQAAITALTANETPLDFEWTSDRAVTVTIGAYEAAIPFDNDIAIVNFNNVSSEAEWNAAVAAINAGGSGREHTITVTGDFSLAGRTTNTFTPTDLTVTIQGDYTISLSGSGSLLNVGAEQNIILQDTNLEGRADNNASLVNVNGGSFTMQGNSEVHGNTVNGDGGGVVVQSSGSFTMLDDSSIRDNTARWGGGVSVFAGSTFTMQDSVSIHGNTAGNWGGGVYVWSGGTFRISGGTVYGNNEGNMSNNAGSGAALSLSGTAQRGTFDGDTFNPLGSLVTTNNTIRVVNGRWIATVSFDTNDGQPATIAPVTIDSGEALGVQFPPAPTRGDFVFGGWFAQDDLMFTTEFNANTVINASVTLVARWGLPLAAPTPSITGSIVSWAPVVGADRYRVYAGTSLIAVSTATSINLRTVSNIGLGTHSITVVAVSNNPEALNSPPSNAVDFVVVEDPAWLAVWESAYVDNRGVVTISPTAVGLVVANRGTGEWDHNNGLAIDIIGLRTLYTTLTGDDAPIIIITGTVPPGASGRFDFQGVSVAGAGISNDSFSFNISADAVVEPPDWGGSPFPFLGTAPGLHFNYTVTGITVGSMSIFELIDVDIISEPLGIPVLTLTDTIVSWQPILNADGYRVYAGTSLITTLTETSINLGTASIGLGTHSITVVAVSNHLAFTNSPPSNAVNFVVAEDPAWRAVWESPFINIRNDDLPVMVSPTTAGLVVSNRGTGPHDNNNGLAIDIIGLRALYVTVTGSSAPTITITGTVPLGTFGQIQFQGIMNVGTVNNNFVLNVDASAPINIPDWGNSDFPFLGTATGQLFNYTVTGITVGSMSIHELLTNP